MSTGTSHLKDVRNAEVNNHSSVQSSAVLLFSHISVGGSANEGEVWQHAS